MKTHASGWLIVPALIVCVFSFAAMTQTAAAGTYSQLVATTTTTGLPSATHEWGQLLGNGAFADGESLTAVAVRADYGIGYTLNLLIEELDASGNYTDTMHLHASTTVSGNMTLLPDTLYNDSVTFQVTKCYRLRFYANGASAMTKTLYGSGSNDWNNSYAGCKSPDMTNNDNSYGYVMGWNPAPIRDFYFQLYTDGTSPIDWGAITVAPAIDFDAIVFVATSSSLFADSTSTLDSIAANCDDAGNLFSRGLCFAGSYLFIPNPAILNSYAQLPTLMQTKFPFSWIAGVKTEFDSLSASASSQSFSVNMTSLGMGSTTAFGNVLPNITLFSTSTITRFMPSGVWNAIQALMAAALWIALGYDIYSTVRRRHHHV